MLSPSSPVPEAALAGTPPRSLPRWWRRAQRLARAAGLALLLLWAVLLAAWLALRWAILPHIDEWRPSVERVASRSLGLKVGLGAIRVQTAGWTPTFELHDLRVYDRDGLEALQVQRVQAALSPRALLAAALRFEQIVIDGARLQARRDVQGRWHFAGQAWEGDFDAADARARDWLLRQGEFVVRHAELHWIDERAGTAPLTLRDLQFVLRNGLRSHALRLDATPPPHWGQRFSLRARFTQPLLARPGELQRWSGTLFADFPQVDAAALRRQLSLPFDPAEGDGALRAWIDIVDGSVRKATADFALRAVTLQLAPTSQPSQPSQPLQPLQPSQPLRLQQLLGRVALARDASGIELRLRQLAAAAPADRAAPPWSIGDVRLSWQQAQDLHQRWTRDTPVTGGEFSADALDLRSLGPLIDALPADAALRERLAGLAPSGHADKLRLRWSGAPQQPDSYRIDAKLRDLTLRAGVSSQPGVPARPGVHAAQIELSATERGGDARVSMRAGALVLPGVWDEPELPLDQLDATLAWQIARRGGDRGSHAAAPGDIGDIELRVSKLSFANADLRGEASAIWRSGAHPGHGRGEHLPGRLELDARLQQVRADRVARYLPLGIAPTAREHVRDAVRAGTVRSASFKVHGDLARFPFRSARDGEFRAVLQLHDVNYAFLGAPWPPVEHASGELEFNRLAMQLRRVQGRLWGYELRGVQGGIADLAADTPVLKLQAQGHGPAADVLRLAQLAPLGPGMGPMLEPVRASGPSTLSLALQLPLAGPQPLTLQGALQLDGTELRVHPDVPPLLDARGSLLVESDTLRLRALHARWLGGEASVDGSIKAAGSLRLNLSGTASAEGLRQWPALAEAAAPLRGQAAWRGTLGADGAGMDLLLQSNLAGMALDLPPPLAKAAAAVLPLRLQLTPLADAAPPDSRREQLQFELGEVLKLQLERERSAAPGGAARVLRASAAVHDTLPALPAAGLQASLNLARVDLDAWRALAARAGTAAGADLLALPGPQQIRLRADELRVDGHAWTRLQATLSQERGGGDTLWRSHVESDQLAGDIEYRVPSADPQAAVLKARLQRLWLPRAPAAAGDGVLGKAQPRLPGLDIVVDDFEWRAHKLGRLQLAAANRALPGAAGLREWQLDRLELDSPDAQLRASARWAASGARRTALDFKLQLHDGGAFAERLGMAGALRGGSGQIDGQLSWAGSPLAPEVTSLDGQLRLELGAGQFLQADPGGARLLGVLSLQALPRRLSLDFRDLFQEGFVFDSVDGDIRVAQGIAHTDNLRLRGMQATVLLNGRADLRRETQDLHVHVVPNFDAAGAALATMAINPVVGLGTLFAQWALREPLIAANTRELHITGSWAEPSVQRIERADRGNAAPADRRPPG